MSPGQSKALVVPTEIACGVIAGPLFVTSFTAIGARRAGYNWRRHAVSSLANGRDGWSQRANFALTGALYCVAAHGLARSPKRTVGPRVVPALIFGVGGGLVGSGLFVTDPVAGFPLSPSEHDDPERTRSIAPTHGGRLHNLCAIPIFAGMPVAALICATSAARTGEYRWASYSAGSAIAMTSASGLFGAAVRRRAPACWAGRCVSAHLDHGRVRMAERPVASHIERHPAVPSSVGPGHRTPMSRETARRRSERRADGCYARRSVTCTSTGCSGLFPSS
jgi:hypothetical protein